MNTENYQAWQLLLHQRNIALYWMLGLSAFLIASYEITYAQWLPQRYAKLIRYAYEVGGVLLYIGTVILSIRK